MSAASWERGHTSLVDTAPLKVVYWNVAGVKAAEIDTFLEQLDFDLRRDGLVLPLYSAARQELFSQAYVKQDI